MMLCSSNANHRPDEINGSLHIYDKS